MGRLRKSVFEAVKRRAVRSKATMRQHPVDLNPALAYRDLRLHREAPPPPELLGPTQVPLAQRVHRPRVVVPAAPEPLEIRAAQAHLARSLTLRTEKVICEERKKNWPIERPPLPQKNLIV